jgi:LacI family repressor for deo operon, udp, cdd, tsx, nupC, and nupG
MDYRPNRLATALANRRTQVIGVQMPSFQHNYLSTLMRSLDRSARSSNYHLLLGAPAAWQDEGDEMTRLYDHQVDGLVVLPQILERVEPALSKLHDRGVPTVYVSNAPEDAEYMVIDDDLGQATLAVDHLIRLGHRRIAHITGSIGSLSSRRRREGFLQTMQRHGLSVPATYVARGSYEYDLSYEVAGQMMALDEPPTAIYCASDAMAVAAIFAVERSGRRVPEDVAIVGHGNDIPFSGFTRIPLTTIVQQPERMGELAMKMVIDCVEDRPIETKHHVLPGTLLVRASSGVSVASQ